MLSGAPVLRMFSVISSWEESTNFSYPSIHLHNTLQLPWLSEQNQPRFAPPAEVITIWNGFTFNVLFSVRILWSFSFMDGFLHRLTNDFLNSFLVEGRRSPRGDRLACSSDL